MPATFNMSLSSDQAAEFLNALTDDDYRAKLAAGPPDTQEALARFGISVSDTIAASFQELPDVETVQAVKAAAAPGQPGFEADLVIPWMHPFGTCCGWGALLVAAAMLRPPEYDGSGSAD